MRPESYNHTLCSIQEYRIPINELGGELLIAMTMPSSLCQDFARILGGTAEVFNGVCTVLPVFEI